MSKLAIGLLLGGLLGYLVDGAGSALVPTLCGAVLLALALTEPCP